MLNHWFSLLSYYYRSKKKEAFKVASKKTVHLKWCNQSPIKKYPIRHQQKINESLNGHLNVRHLVTEIVGEKKDKNTSSNYKPCLFPIEQGWGRTPTTGWSIVHENPASSAI